MTDMPTAACGINCDVCRLHARGLCSTCGPGTSPEAARKIRLQEQLLGQPCPILACARMNQIAHCLGDCDAFPCENFTRGPYPFGQGFLQMQDRRRRDLQKSEPASSPAIQAPSEFWEDLQRKNLPELCDIALARQENPETLTLDFLHTEIRVHPFERNCFLKQDGQWRMIDHSLLKPQGVLLLEMGYNQKTAVAEVIQDCGRYPRFHFLKDYAGHNRVVVIYKT